MAEQNPLNNGNGSAPSDPDPESFFWQDPAARRGEDLHWYDPPIPAHHSLSARVGSLLERLSGLMGPESFRSWLVDWTFQTRAEAAATEMEEVEHDVRSEFRRQSARADLDINDLDRRIQNLQESRDQTQAALRAAHADFAGAAAEAGLSCTADGITPDRVRHSLLETAPGLHDVAGAEGVTPVEDHVHTVGSVFKGIFIFLAPWVCGFMLALCLGTLVGLLDLSDLKKLDQSGFKLAMAAGLGFVIVYLMGELVSTAVTSLARCKEVGGRGECPRLGWSGRAAGVLLVLAVLLATAEITAETFGIRQLHQQHIMAMQRVSGTVNRAATPAGRPLPTDDGTQPLHIAIYALMGLLISGPYLAYKSARAWNDNENRLRESWLLHRQREWVDRKWAEPAAQKTFESAHRIQRLETDLKEIREELKAARTERDALQAPVPDPRLQARRDAARAAAVGEATRLHRMVESIVEAHEPGILPANPPAARTGFFRPKVREENAVQAEAER